MSANLLNSVDLTVDTVVCRKFDEAFLNAVDFAFNSLGRSCRQALYFYLETTFQVSKAEIPSKVKEFDSALRLIFKDGAFFLERLILERLCEDLGVKFEESRAVGFVEAVSRIESMALEKESSLVALDFEEFAVAGGKRGGEES